MTPSANRAFIDLATGAVRNSTTGTITPRIAGILGTQLSLVVSFFRDSVPTALTDGSPGKLVLKSKLSHGSPALVLDTAWNVSGDGPARTYKFDALLDSQALRAKLEGKESDFFAAQIEWSLPGETDPSKSLPFDVVVFNAYSRDGDEAPDPIASASWEWLKDRAPQSGGFMHNNNERTLSVSAGTGAPGEDGASAYEVAVENGFVGDVNAWLASLVGATGQPGAPGADGPLITWKSVWNGGAYDQNDAVSYAGSSWLSLRGNTGIAPSEGADWALIAAKGTDGSNGINGANGVFSEIASQAEAEAGTETSKGMTPERVAQAIAALANGGSSINWLGEWQSNVTYAEGDAVSYGGSSWFSILNGNTNYAPFEGSSYWGLLARAGTNGMDGQPGEPGTNGSNGIDGTNATPITGISDDGNGNLTVYTQNGSYGPFALKGPQGAPGMDGVPGSGDVTGPGSCTDGNIATFNGTSGKVIQDSGVGIVGGNLYVNGTKVLGSQEAGVADASESHSMSGSDYVNYNALIAALNDLGTKFNAMKAALEAHGLITTV